ncbi:P-loop containing nucleoside triphosphate hydrolase protein, partial [Blyttiomyces helicus]
LGIPQIAVVGDQSSGKSSLLEEISGIRFPRGTGTVMRCTTELRMTKSDAGSPFSARVFTSADDEDRKTRELCGGKGRSFSEESIVIELESPDVQDLTLIDLPGIIRTATGSQTLADIEQVNKIVEDYMAEERTIILAFVPANQDIATVDVLERVRRVDPSGSRTIGVLTKPDLIDEGAESHLFDILENKTNPLKLGWIVVRNR